MTVPHPDQQARLAILFTRSQRLADHLTDLGCTVTVRLLLRLPDTGEPLIPDTAGLLRLRSHDEIHQVLIVEASESPTPVPATLHAALLVLTLPEDVKRLHRLINGRPIVATRCATRQRGDADPTFEAVVKTHSGTPGLSGVTRLIAKADLSRSG